MSRPLQGVRIVDLGLYVAGPYASVPLVDLGADVIKIEPLGGDPNRTIWRAFACCNRGKRVISLDLKSPEGLEIAQQLCGQADVVHHNFRPGVMDRIGLGFESLKKHNPQLVYLEASAYGATGPLSALPGFDMMMQALCGHEAYGAGAGNDPAWMRWAPVDFTGGYLGTIGILAGLYRKAREGQGGVIQGNLLDGGIYLLSQLIRNGDGSFSGLEMLNADQTGTSPAYSLYHCQDGWIAVVARSPQQQEALAQAANLNEEPGTPAKEWSELSQQSIAALLADMSSEQAVTFLREIGVWAEPCRQDFQKSLFSDEQWQSSGILRESPHSRYEQIRQIGSVVRFSDAGEAVETSGMVAEPGEHTREILAGMGFSESAIDDLYERKIVA